jgi:DNA-binding transcriptional MerR regulator
MDLLIIEGLTLAHILSVLTALLFSGTAYLLKRFINTVNKLETTINQFSVVIAVEQEKARNVKESLDLVKEMSDSHICSLTKRIEELEKEMVVLHVINDKKNIK